MGPTDAGLLDPHLISEIGISEWMINFLYLINPVNPRSFMMGQKVFLARVTSCFGLCWSGAVWASCVLSLVVNRLTSWFWWQTEIASVLGSVAVSFPIWWDCKLRILAHLLCYISLFTTNLGNNLCEMKTSKLWGFFQLPLKKFSIIY